MDFLPSITNYPLAINSDRDEEFFDFERSIVRAVKEENLNEEPLVYTATWCTMSPVFSKLAAEYSPGIAQLLDAERIDDSKDLDTFDLRLLCSRMYRAGRLSTGISS